MQNTTLSPTDFVALLNQTLEFAYPSVVIEGELSNLRIARNRWLYFNLKDEVSTVSFFGTVYQMPGPLQDGLTVRVVGAPRFHHKFGFALNVQSIVPVGEGSIKKAADLVAIKLHAEGLFSPERKRHLPTYPNRIGLITAAGSAAYADFIKIVSERWGGLEILFGDTAVQGDQAPLQLVRAIEYFNQLPQIPDLLVVTRGGGSADDLAAFSDERVVRAVASSRVPTVVAVGHEVDESLAELAADVRASTPSNAAQIVVPDRVQSIAQLNMQRRGLQAEVIEMYSRAFQKSETDKQRLANDIDTVLGVEAERLGSSRRLLSLFNPAAALKRGYAMIRSAGTLVTNTSQVKPGKKLDVFMAGGRLKVTTNEVLKT